MENSLVVLHLKAEQLKQIFIQLITLIDNDFNSNSDLQITLS
jgi:hypothetical protein